MAGRPRQPNQPLNEAHIARSLLEVFATRTVPLLLRACRLIALILIHVVLLRRTFFKVLALFLGMGECGSARHYRKQTGGFGFIKNYKWNLCFSCWKGYNWKIPKKMLLKKICQVFFHHALPWSAVCVPWEMFLLQQNRTSLDGKVLFPSPDRWVVH